MDKEKTGIEIVIIGDVYSGKSTLIEQLIYKCGGVDKRTIEKCEKLSATTADCVVLMVSACIGEFENSISENGQTRQQILFAYMLGAKQMIIAVNKMDANTVSYSENRFNQIQIELSTYLKQIGYPLENVAFVPISAWNGDNLVTISNKMVWFTGWIVERQEGNVICKTFLEALDTIAQRQQFMDKPLRLPLQDVYKVRGIGTVAMGRVETGVLKRNMTVSFSPLNLTATVRSIEMCYETLEGN
ncbi:unnamed protein product [Rotaria sp. Silwood1]|nr:unnamed protein product [Rotaria sp. Silwood1]